MMKILKDLLNETSLDVFLEKHFTKIPFSITGGANKYISLLNWEVIAEIFKVNKSVLRIVQDGKVLKDYVDISLAEAKAHHLVGHTLLVRFAEKSHPKLKELADDFAKSFHTLVDIQLYLTPEGHNAFGWHYDVEEVFILQTEGSKHYTIRPNTIHPNPLVSSIPKDLGYENEKTPIEINVTLEKGDFLYIPSGWWHKAQTRKESMHISIGLMPNSALDIVQYLPQFLAQEAFWRTRMPLHVEFNTPEEEVNFYSEAMEKLGKELSKKMASPEFIKQFIHSRKSKT